MRGSPWSQGRDPRRPWGLGAPVVALQATKTTDHQLTGLGFALLNHAKEFPAYYTDFACLAAGWMAFLEAYPAACGSV